MNESLLVPVSNAELLDKISILEIKKMELADPEKLSHVDLELNALKTIAKENDLLDLFKDDLYFDLKKINLDLWHICDLRRKQELLQDFGEDFIRESRREYLTNDKRAAIKNEINKKCNSLIREVKSYD